MNCQQPSEVEEKNGSFFSLNHLDWLLFATLVWHGIVDTLAMDLE